MNRTYQEIFNEGLVHMRKQGHPAVRRSSGSIFCCYHGPAGNCVIGGVVTKEAAEKFERYGKRVSLSGVAVSRLPEELMYESFGRISKNDIRFLSDLQSCHDKPIKSHNSMNQLSDKEFMTEFEVNMEAMAKQYGLDYNEPAAS